MEMGAIQINKTLPQRKRSYRFQTTRLPEMRRNISGKEQLRPSKLRPRKNGPKYLYRNFRTELSRPDRRQLNSYFYRDNGSQTHIEEEENRCSCKLGFELRDGKVDAHAFRHSSRRTISNGISAPHNTTQFLMKDIEVRYNFVDENKSYLLSSSNILPPNSDEAENKLVIARSSYKPIPYLFDEEYEQMNFEESYSAYLKK
eukprot:gene20180-22155_t